MVTPPRRKEREAGLGRHGVLHLPAEAHLRKRRPVSSDEFPVQPGRAAACHLPTEIEIGQCAHSKILAVCAGVMGAMPRSAMSSGIFQ